MTTLTTFARRHPAGAAAMAGLALVLLPATLLSRGRMSHAAPPAPDPSASAAAQESQARALLAAVRGISPVACALAVQAVGNGWGFSGDAEDAPALGRGDADARPVLEWANGRSPSRDDVATLSDGLGDPDTCVRRMAARLLARANDAGGTDALVGALRGGDATRREAAILGLGWAGDARAVQPLIGLLADADPEVRGGAAWALGHTESHDAAGPLQRLTEDREPRVRRAAARALGRLEDGSSVPALARLLASDPDAGVRRAAAWALGHIE
jgi:hypothetical protein